MKALISFIYVFSFIFKRKAEGNHSRSCIFIRDEFQEKTTTVENSALIFFVWTKSILEIFFVNIHFISIHAYFGNFCLIFFS